MKLKTKKRPYKKIALVLSLCVLVIWTIIGTGTSLAWFTDTTPEINNIFHFADFDLEVSYLKDGDWKEITSQEKVFDDEALYEPGYVQVVNLRVKNNGSKAFNFDTAVMVTDFTFATNVFGQPLCLQNYLKFGLITANTEQEMKENIPDRESAKKIATNDLNDYSTKPTPLNANEEIFITLIVRMPEEIGNVANYRDDLRPEVELGIIVKADQVKE